MPKTSKRQIKDIFPIYRRKNGSMRFDLDYTIKKLRNHLVEFIGAQSKRNSRQLAKSAVRETTRFYKKTCLAEKDPSKRLWVKANNINLLVLAAHICQEYELNGVKHILRDILAALLEVEGGFDRFFSFLDPLSTPGRVDIILYPKRNDHPDMKSDYYFNILEYFLNEVANVPVTMVYSRSVTRRNLAYAEERRNTCFIDAPLVNSYGCTPLTVSCHAMNLKAITILLRYGADPEARGCIHQELGHEYPISVLLYQYHALAFWRDRIANIQQDDEEVLESQRNYESQQHEIRKCVALLDRSVIDISRTAKDPQHQLDVIRAEEPSLRGSGVPPLQHISRVTIRRCLKKAGALPYGIPLLSTHLALERYLDLQIA